MIKQLRNGIAGIFWLLCWVFSASALAQTATTVVYYHNDLLGSPVAATDESGNVLWREDYAPYGQKLSNDMEAAVDKVGYTGHRYDSSTGLVYAGARMYDPMLGRFMGIDPVSALEAVNNPVMFNRYAYGNNNPYKYVDPDGENPLAVLVLFVGLVTLSEIANTPDVGQEPQKLSNFDYASSFLGAGFKPLKGFRVGRGSSAPKKAKKVSTDPPVQQVDPRNLIPTQTRNEISGSQVKRLKKDMQKNGFDQSQPVDVVRNPRGRLEIQDGHHRTEAARKAGLDKIPVRVWGDSN